MHALDEHFMVESYIAAKDGGISPIGLCLECGVEAYLAEGDLGCVWCGFVLRGDCARRHASLAVENVLKHV